ncbi:hypothetical protein O181_005971 [Austropuccinia psidii MF-1]|uniref:Uncharacterized protein n=1 Tax=Austropuccinia psidii MF-1 TaxID=1389203 RepID=A0A9Q3GGC6_9BASI|nr:hypothetical protein [Austropuccinia psidii MF-1]
MLAYFIVCLRNVRILISRDVLLDKSKYPCLSTSKVVDSPLMVPFRSEREEELVDEIKASSSDPQERVYEVCVSDGLVQDLSNKESVDEFSSLYIAEEPTPLPTVVSALPML